MTKDSSTLDKVTRIRADHSSNSVYATQGQQDVGVLLGYIDALEQSATASEKDAARYRYLRDRAGNKIMQLLMDTAIPPEWDRLVDADMEKPNDE